MSGSKHAQARPNPSVTLQRELGPLLQKLIDLRRSYDIQSSQRDARELQALRQTARQAQNDFDQYKVVGEERDRLFGALEQCDLILSECSRAERDLITVSRIDAQLSDLNRVISSRSTTGLSACRSSTQNVIADTHRAISELNHLSRAEFTLRALLESVGYDSSAQGALKPREAQSTQRVEREQAREAALSAQRALEARAAKQRALREIAEAITLDCSSEEERASAMSEDARKLGEFEASDHRASLDEARGILSSAELDESMIEAARRLLERATRQRISSEERAQVNLERVKERDLLAAHLSTNLINLHYDDPDVYLDDEELGERSDLILFAQAPSERLSVRVTLELTGGMRFDINGVPEGEERTCISLLNGFRDAAAQAEVELSVLDYGRATEALTSAPRERVKRLEREKMKEHKS